MKKSLLFILIFTLLVLPSISAADFEMKTNLSQGETIFAKISGDFIEPPLKENIEFFRGHVRVAFESDLIKIGDTFYIYANTIGKAPNNYSIRISEVEYKRLGAVIDDDLERNFTIKEDIADFALLQGLYSTNKDFFIDIENLGTKTILVNYNLSILSGEAGGISSHEEGEEYEVEIAPGTERVNFLTEPVKEPRAKLITFYNDNLSYEVPISLFATEEQIGGKTFDLEFFPEELDVIVPTGAGTEKVIYIYNTGSGTLTDLELELSESLRPFIIELSEDSFGQIIPESNAHFNMTLVSGSERTVEGTLRITSEQGASQILNIRINFEDDYEIPPEEQVQQLVTEQTCQELSLPICVKPAVCDGEDRPAKNGVCCIGTCSEPIKSNTGKIIGWTILVIVIALGAWFFLKRYRRVKRPIDLLEESKGKRRK